MGRTRPRTVDRRGAARRDGAASAPALHADVRTANAHDANGIADLRLVGEQGEAPLPDRDGTLVALLGHELRAPVSAIQAATELLIHYLDGDLNSRESRLAIYRIHGLAVRLGAMIHDLFELARISTGQAALALVEVDSTEAVMEAVEIARSLPGMPDIRVETPNEGCTVQADAGSLRTAVLNLLTNAAKHASETKHIDVRVRPGYRELTIDVEDYGPGIPPDELARAFAPFVQGRRHREDASHGPRRADGLGLGLFIVEQIVRAHGGSITVESTVGIGTRLTLHLPRFDD